MLLPSTHKTITMNRLLSQAYGLYCTMPQQQQMLFWEESSCLDMGSAEQNYSIWIEMTDLGTSNRIGRAIILHDGANFIVKRVDLQLNHSPIPFFHPTPAPNLF